MEASGSNCPRCGDRKHPDHFACRACWFMLPNKIRNDIWNAYREHGFASTEWVEAAKRAFEAWDMEVPRWLQALEEVT